MDLEPDLSSIRDPMVDVRAVTGEVTLAGEVITTPTVLKAAGPGAAIVSFAGAVITAPVHVGEGVDLAGCDFEGAVGLDRLRFARSPFPRRSGRFVVEGAGGPALRQLRLAAKRSGLWTLADDLHIGELEAARRSARPGPKRLWLELYRIAGGYGHRPSRPIATYIVLVLAFTWMFQTFPNRFVGNDFWMGNYYVDYPEWNAVLFKLMVRISLTPLSPIDPTGMHSDGFALLMALKLATVMLLIFTGMGLRSRLRR